MKTGAVVSFLLALTIHATSGSPARVLGGEVLTISVNPEGESSYAGSFFIRRNMKILRQHGEGFVCTIADTIKEQKDYKDVIFFVNQMTPSDRVFAKEFVDQEDIESNLVFELHGEKQGFLGFVIFDEDPYEFFAARENLSAEALEGDVGGNVEGDGV